MPFTARPRDLRTFLHDTSVKAMVRANEARTGMSGDPVAAGAARVVAAVLGEVRDAMDVGAPWLRDLSQVGFVLAESARLAQKAGVAVAVPPGQLAELVVSEALEAEQAAAAGGEAEGPPNPSTPQ